MLKTLKPAIKPFVYLFCSQVLVGRAQAYLLISSTNLCDLCTVFTFGNIALFPSRITCPVRLLMLLVHNLSPFVKLISLACHGIANGCALIAEAMLRMRPLNYF